MVTRAKSTSTTRKAAKKKTTVRKPKAAAARKKKSEKHDERRRFIRFPAEPDAYALIDARAKTKEFSPHIAALIVEDSHMGCRVIFPETDFLKEGMKVRVCVGKFGTWIARLAWCQRLAPRVHQGGFEYIKKFE